MGQKAFALRCCDRDTQVFPDDFGKIVTNESVVTLVEEYMVACGHNIHVASGGVNMGGVTNIAQEALGI